VNPTVNNASNTLDQTPRVPCLQALAVGESVVLAGDTIYCRACYDHLASSRPTLVSAVSPFTLQRGVTCGGGYAKD